MSAAAAARPPLADLVAQIAAGPVAGDDGECLIVDLKLGLDGWQPWPLRVLQAAADDDELWAIMVRARAKIERRRTADAMATAAAEPLTPRAGFVRLLAEVYRDLFDRPDYAIAKARTTPEALAEKMTAGLLDGSANKDGDGIVRVCRMLGIRHSYKAIRAYCKGDT